MKPNKYKILDKVYHITPESEQGSILDASYSLLNDRWQYRVSFGIKDNDYWYDEHELCLNKIFV